MGQDKKSKPHGFGLGLASLGTRKCKGPLSSYKLKDVVKAPLQAYELVTEGYVEVTGSLDNAGDMCKPEDVEFACSCVAAESTDGYSYCGGGGASSEADEGAG